MGAGRGSDWAVTGVWIPNGEFRRQPAPPVRKMPQTYPRSYMQ